MIKIADIMPLIEENEREVKLDENQRRLHCNNK
jgi:hypothetical protein